MELTQSQLKSFFPANNLVLVRPVVDMTKVHNTTLDLAVPTVDGKPWDTFKNAPIVCEITSAPRKLFCCTRRVEFESVIEMDVPMQAKAAILQHRRQNHYTETTMIDQVVPHSMMWHTTVQVKPGDVVWVNPNAMAQAEYNDMTIEADGKRFYLIPYEALYMKKVGEKVTMINGWVLCEPIEEAPDWATRLEKAGLFIPAHLKKQPFNDRLAIVRYMGDPVEYLKVNDDQRYDHPEIKVGDVVMLARSVNRRLEPHYKFFAKDNQDYIVTRRENIRAIMD